MNNVSNLFDQIIKANNLANDAALARSLGMFPPTICRVRSGHMALGPTMILAIHDRFERPVPLIRSLAGLPVYAPPQAGMRAKKKRQQLGA